MKPISNANLDTILTEITHDGTTHVKRLISPGDLYDGNVATMNYAWLEPQKQLTIHSHPDGEELYFFLDGTGEILIDKTWIHIERHSFIHIPVGKNHSVKNTGASNLYFITLRTVHNDH